MNTQIIAACEHKLHGLFNFSRKNQGAWANYSEPTKKCGGCGELKSLDLFSKDKAQVDGFNRACKKCRAAICAAYVARHPERRKETSSAYYKNNADKQAIYKAAYKKENAQRIKEANALYRAKTQDERNAYNENYRKTNKEKIVESNAAYRENNQEKVKAANRAWVKANPEAIKIVKHTRRAKEKSLGGKLSKGITSLLMSEQGGKCAGCLFDLTKTGHHLDHVMPLALGGANQDWNMQLLCPPCNHQKNATHPLDWMMAKGILTQ